MISVEGETMSSPDMAGILDNSKELDRLRKEREEFLLAINMIHKKLQTTPEVVEKPGDDSLSTLKMLYTPYVAYYSISQADRTLKRPPLSSWKTSFGSISGNRCMI